LVLREKFSERFKTKLVSTSALVKINDDQDNNLQF